MPSNNLLQPDLCHQRRVLSATARHSVGVHFNKEILWYHAPTMCWGDAWAFDTQHSPHVAVDLGRHPTFVRHSAEVRSLILHPISTDMCNLKQR